MFGPRKVPSVGLSTILLGLALSNARPALADQPQTTPPGPAPAAKRPNVSPRLQSTAPVAAVPEAIHNPTRKQAPRRIHQRPWGVFNRDGGAPAGFGPVARFGIDRSAEDWSYLRDPGLSDDVFDPLKFMPLTSDKSVYLTLSLDERLRNWYETRPFLGQTKPNDSGRFTNRTTAGADLHLGPFFHVYGELINGDAAGWAYYGYNQTYRKTLDVQQAYAEATLPVDDAKVGAKVGRFEFFDAPNYLIYGRETPNIPLSWNGVQAYVFWPRVRLDVFDLVQTNTNPTDMFADTENYKARLFGAYESWAVPDFHFLGQPGHVFLDFFYLGYDYGGSKAPIATAEKTASGTTHRDNIGTRVWGKVGPIEFSLGGVYQGGQFTYAKSTRSRAVDAYAINTIIGYRAAALRFNPFFAVQADLYSGGNYNRTSGSIGTYIAPYYPQTGYLDTTTYIAPSNLIDVGPRVELRPTDNTALIVKVPFFWRASTNDAVYGASQIYDFRGKYAGGYVGVDPQIELAYRITRHLTWTNDFARFLVSDALAHAGGQNGTYYQSTLDFRF